MIELKKRADQMAHLRDYEDTHKLEIWKEIQPQKEIVLYTPE